MENLANQRKNYKPTLPNTLKDLQSITLEKGEHPSHVDSNVAELIPNTKSQPFMHITEKKSDVSNALKIGVVLSGGQAAGGHNVITGIYDAIKKINPNSELIGFLNGPSGIINSEYKELTSDFIDLYRNQGGFDMIGAGRTKIETLEQFENSAKTVTKLNLDGIVIIGGDDSNTNAALLAEYFEKENIKTKVVGVPKTIDGDLKNEHIEVSFGFDTATKTYSDIIGNIARDALSAGKYYFFIKMMGRSASHVTLECALQTHPNYTIIAEEVAANKKTLQSIADEMCDMIIKRAEKGKNHGVILIPEGTIEFIPEFKALISELNDLLSTSKHAEKIANTENREERINLVTQQLSKESAQCYQTLPYEIKLQMIMDRDPHGNVQVSKIETERLFIELVKSQLKEKSSKYKGKFSAQPLFCGYEGRSCLPSNFDSQYCYSLGHVAALLINSGVTGYMASVQNLTLPVKDWTVAGIPISAMMTMEKRKGKLKPVIEKALVDLNGKPFQKFVESRESWKFNDEYIYPGPIQFFGPESITDLTSITLDCEKSHSVSKC
ncbi:MAG: diphosphate--fructose-6-phosphate 1-phosphotransferase [Chlamydiota bacterium]|nr:diphosphate--fructose-6-phosphate 1-phosphotransferase [Chlamydiota bacterium]